MPIKNPVHRSELAKAFGGSTESWMRRQLLYDLAEVEKRSATIKVKRYESA